MNPLPIRRIILEKLRNLLMNLLMGRVNRPSWKHHYTSVFIAPENIRFGKGPHFPGDSPFNYIQAINGIIIGDDVNIGPGVGLISADHDLKDNKKHLKGHPIIIGNNVWIGMNALILPEVQLGNWVVVGAGAVVTESFPNYTILAGNPAKVVGFRCKKCLEKLVKREDKFFCKLCSREYLTSDYK
jgi:acetyltransferase-like isoleucine patch superfamily enzyme